MVDSLKMGWRTKFRERETCDGLWNIYATTKPFPISLREVKRPLKSPRREQCCCGKDALTMYYKTVKLRDVQNPIDMLGMCKTDIFSL